MQCLCTRVTINFCFFFRFCFLWLACSTTTHHYSQNSLKNYIFCCYYCYAIKKQTNPCFVLLLLSHHLTQRHHHHSHHHQQHQHHRFTTYLLFNHMIYILFHINSLSLKAALFYSGNLTLFSFRILTFCFYIAFAVKEQVLSYIQKQQNTLLCLLIRFRQ